MQRKFYIAKAGIGSTGCDMGVIPYSAVPASVQLDMTGKSWKPGCPLPFGKLSLVRVRHHGYDGRIHDGELIVHQDLASEVSGIFEELLAARFPIEKVRRIDCYGADDELSMADNNTSAFCYRRRPHNPKLSWHALGCAIDINPLVNPFVRESEHGLIILPAAGARYADRSLRAKGMVLPGDACYEAFVSRGWFSGIDFKSHKDYQHFEKRLAEYVPFVEQ